MMKAFVALWIPVLITTVVHSMSLYKVGAPKKELLSKNIRDDKREYVAQATLPLDEEFSEVQNDKDFLNDAEEEDNLNDQEVGISDDEYIDDNDMFDPVKVRGRDNTKPFADHELRESDEEKREREQMGNDALKYFRRSRYDLLNDLDKRESRNKRGEKWFSRYDSALRSKMDSSALNLKRIAERNKGMWNDARGKIVRYANQVFGDGESEADYLGSDVAELDGLGNDKESYSRYNDYTNVE